MLSICIAVGPKECFSSLLATLESIANQTVHPYAVVVKTVGLHLADDIHNYINQARRPNITLLVGNDKGIYDAFNICVKSAKSKYVIFLGCGDLLADIFVIEDIVQHSTDQALPDIIYGPVLLSDVRGDIVATFENDSFFRSKRHFPWRNPCHSQGLVYARNWLVGRPFKTDIGPIADLVHTYQHGVFDRASWINRPISIFRAGGISNRRDIHTFTARLLGVYVNCENFRFPLFWKFISGLVFRVGYILRK